MDTHHRINYIEFPGKNLEALKTFYGAVFGWTFTDYGPDYTAFSDGALDGGFTTEASPGKGALVILYSEKLEDSLDSVQKQGGTIVKNIFEFPGGRRFHFTDPDGNELAVWSKI